MTDPEDDIAAAELALGVLEGEERAAALRRVLSDPEFAVDVERWREHFGLLFTQWPDEQAPEGLADRLDSSISPAARSRLWPALALAASAVAAVLAGVLLLQPGKIMPPPIEQAAAPSLVANLAAPKGGTPVPAIYDPARREIHVAASAFVQTGRSAELWLIPADGVPRSLGLLMAGSRSKIRLTPDLQRLVSANAALAISEEPVGGSPSGKPTGAVVASGKLIPV